MNQLLFILVIAAVLYVIYRLSAKEPINPFKNKNANTNTKMADGATQTKSALKSYFAKEEDLGPLDEIETAPFQELYPDFIGVESHMARQTNNRFTMMAEVIPANYFLRDSFEQNGINVNFETWLAQITDSRVYLQNRYVDLTDAVDNIKQNIQEDEGLNEFSVAYGKSLIRNMEFWQKSQPRYDLKRFVLFDYQVNVKDIKTEGLSEEEIDEKIVDKAFNECRRRFFSCQSQLRKAEMKAELLSGDGIIELGYYTFNRRKALKNRYRDIENQEQASLYVTADTTPERIAAVKAGLNAMEEEKHEVTA